MNEVPRSYVDTRSNLLPCNIARISEHDIGEPPASKGEYAHSPFCVTLGQLGKTKGAETACKGIYEEITTAERKLNKVEKTTSYGKKG